VADLMIRTQQATNIVMTFWAHLSINFQISLGPAQIIKDSLIFKCYYSRH